MEKKRPCLLKMNQKICVEKLGLSDFASTSGLDCLLCPADSLVLTFFLCKEGEVFLLHSVLDYERGVVLYLNLCGSFASRNLQYRNEEIGISHLLNCFISIFHLIFIRYDL